MMSLGYHSSFGRSCSSVLRSIFTEEVAAHFTWRGHKRFGFKKEALCSTQTSNTLIEELGIKWNVSKNLVEKSISSWLAQTTNKSKQAKRFVITKMSTVEYVRRLPLYPLFRGGQTEDPFVSEIIQDCVDRQTLESLSEYTRGMYDLDLHYTSFEFFKRPLQVDDVYSSNVQHHPSFLPALQRTREQLSPLLGTSLIRPSNLDSVSWIPTSAAGFGYVGAKRDNYLLARKNATRALYGFSKWRERYRFVPDKAFARKQLSLRANSKIRHVWGRAFHHILLEGLIGQPLLEKLLLTDTPIYIWRDIHKDMPIMVLRHMSDSGTCYCIDFSKFDSSICRFLVHTAWEIIRSLITITDHIDQLVLDFCYCLFTNTPLVMPDGRLYIVRAGVPSGSYFTQLIDSIINLLLINMFMHSTMRTFVDVKVLGDDSLFVTPHPICEREDLNTFFNEFGLTVSDKTVITNNVSEIVFLGHNFYGSRVSRDKFTCLCLALFTEDGIFKPSESILRVCSLIYDAGFNSFVLLNIYKHLLTKHNIDWDLEFQRPYEVSHPFLKLFTLG